MQPRNLLLHHCPSKHEEHFDMLLKQQGVTLEQIHSPAKFKSELFNQSHDEWVLLLQGEATLLMDDEPVKLVSGDSLLIPANTPHQVVSTTSNPACIWLALHLPDKNT